MKASYLKYIFALLLFGSNGIVASLIHLSSYEIVLLRTLIGSLLLVAIFFIAREKLTFYKYKTQSIFLAVSGIASGYLEPLSAVVFPVVFLKEAMMPIQIIGAVLIIGGAMLGEYRKK